MDSLKTYGVADADRQKYFEIKLAENWNKALPKFMSGFLEKRKARSYVRGVCKDLLMNSVYEEFSFRDGDRK